MLTKWLFSFKSAHLTDKSTARSEQRWFFKWVIVSFGSSSAFVNDMVLKISHVNVLKEEEQQRYNRTDPQ